MCKHTEGPWRKCGLNVSVGSETYYLLKNKSDIKMGELEANTHLIAAAPETKEQRDDLLEVLQYVLEIIKDDDQPWWINCPDSNGFDVDKIEAAIAKATP